MKKLITLIFVSFTFISSVLAHDVEVNGIYYNLIKKLKTAEVTKRTSGYKVYSGDIVIPETIEVDGITYTVTKIDNNVFSYCDKLLSVSMPNTIESIGDYAFYKCKIKKNLFLSLLPV